MISNPELAEWIALQESSFAKAFAEGYLELNQKRTGYNIRKYCELVQNAGQNGPTLGRFMATYLVPVLKYGTNCFLEEFLSTVEIMLKKGAYILNSPMDALSLMLNSGDVESGSAYLSLLCDTFSQHLTYNHSHQLSYSLPVAVLSFSSSKRNWQIEQFRRVIKKDALLTDAFIKGMEKGLNLLSKDSLDSFISLGLEKIQQNEKLGIKFLSLDSKLGIDTYTDMQVTVPFSQVQHQLNRYLRARTGISISVRPIKPEKENSKERIKIYSDGKFIYLPDEISRFDSRKENLNLYKCLTKLEAAYYEFNTFDFDPEKLTDRLNNPRSVSCNLSDLELFFNIFPVKELASDLFTIFEHGRIRILLTQTYPGIVRQAFPLLRHEAARIYNQEKNPLSLLYELIGLGNSLPPEYGTTKFSVLLNIVELFEKRIDEDNRVETCAELVFSAYDLFERENPAILPYIPLKIPFDRKLRPDLFYSTYQNLDKTAEKIKLRIEEKGAKIYKSDIRKHLIENNGAISVEEIKELTLSDSNETISADYIKEILKNTNLPELEIITPDSGDIFRYKEWDCRLGDYLHDHVRVRSREVKGLEDDFYKFTLDRYIGLVSQIRRAFELLKPEGLTILRRWIEGDEFDYRAMLNFAIDKKAGIMPSDRLYIKRIKQQRDVAVMLLVDLSRSTANPVAFQSAENKKEVTVLDVEKEAIVLFCEALQVVGDNFAIAGFSGTGRLGVDYFRIKDFDELMNDTIRERINAVTPQRSTRMGAAIRHAAAQLEKVSAGVRIMIILGDGFPNDADYKQEYAIEDTRKAISEARSKNIYARAITVNIAGDSKLDNLYGALHHNVISDVRELPDKLLRIYSSLTR